MLHFAPKNDGNTLNKLQWYLLVRVQIDLELLSLSSAILDVMIKMLTRVVSIKKKSEKNVFISTVFCIITILSLHVF